MIEESIIELAKIAHNRPHLSFKIINEQNNNKYRILGFIYVVNNDKCLTYISYQCLETGKTYARNPDDFKNCSI